MGKRSSGRRSTTPPGRPAKVPVGGTGGGHATPPAPGRREFENWLAQWMGRTKRMAAGFSRDFLKSRKKNTQTPGVRARLETLLEKYSEWTDELGEEFRNIPGEFHAVVAEIEATGRDYIWAAAQRTAECVDAIHDAIERQRAQIAAPMTESEERQFWWDTKKLVVGLEKLQKLAEALRKAIKDRREVEDTDAMQLVERACDRLSNSVVRFAAHPETTEKSSSERINDVQDAAEAYRQQLTQLENAILQANASHVVGIHDETGTQYSVRLDDMQSSIRVQALVLDTVLFRHNLSFMLPTAASDAALEIQRIVKDVQRANLTLAARIETHSGDPSARCDTIYEKEIPDYTRLGDTAKEHEQFRVIVDSLLMLCDSRGQDATMDRKQLQRPVDMLATHRKVAGLGTTSLLNKLDQLVGKKVVRKFPAKKTKLDPNASDQYRLSIPALKKYDRHAAAVRAEFEHIAALSPAADPFD